MGSRLLAWSARCPTMEQPLSCATSERESQGQTLMWKRTCKRTTVEETSEGPPDLTISMRPYSFIPAVEIKAYLVVSFDLPPLQRHLYTISPELHTAS